MVSEGRPRNKNYVRLKISNLIATLPAALCGVADESLDITSLLAEFAKSVVIEVVRVVRCGRSCDTTNNSSRSRLFREHGKNVNLDVGTVETLIETLHSFHVTCVILKSGTVNKKHRTVRLGKITHYYSTYLSLWLECRTLAPEVLSRWG